MKKLFINICFIIVSICFFELFADEAQARKQIIERIVKENKLDPMILKRPYIAGYGWGNWAIIAKDSTGYSIYSIERINAKDKILHKYIYSQPIDVFEWFFNNNNLSQFPAELTANKGFHAYDYYIIGNVLSTPFIFNAEDKIIGTNEEFKDLIEELNHVVIWLSSPQLRTIMNDPFIK